MDTPNSPMTPDNTLGGSAYLPKPKVAKGVTKAPRVQPTFAKKVLKGKK